MNLPPENSAEALQFREPSAPPHRPIYQAEAEEHARLRRQRIRERLQTAAILAAVVALAIVWWPA